jgi:protein ImuB
LPANSCAVADRPAPIASLFPRFELPFRPRRMPRSSSPASPQRRSIAAIISLLHKWGIHTLGDFARLDKQTIAARLGPEGVHLWERAQGKSIRLLRVIEPPESFVETYEFEHEIETADPLLFVLRRFLEQLALRLSAIYLVAKTLILRIQFSNRQSYGREFHIPDPTNEVDLLFRMLQTHLENFKSEHPIVAVSLEAEPIKPLPQQFGLFEATLRNPNQLFETLARLAALLGNNRVGTAVLQNTHRPDSFRIEPFTWELNESRTTTAEQTRFTPALRRFRPTRPANVMLENRDPIHIRSNELNNTITNKAGPYCASGQWWDNDHWTRQEWDAELDTGEICRFHIDHNGWAIDGIYD